MVTEKNSVVNHLFQEVNNSHFHPDHYEDLKKSGLTDQTILEAGIYSVPPSEINRILPPFLSKKVTSLLVFPYPGNGFVRYKLFPSITDSEGHSIRYYQKKGSSVHLYIPPGVEKVLSDPSICLNLIEGEKKSLKATQEGIPCIGLGGIWNWKQADSDSLIPEFDLINFQNRQVLLTPDSDFQTNENVRLAVYRLALKLVEKGAIVSSVHLPGGNGTQKIGLDDYLLDHSREDFLSLPRTRLTPEVCEAEILRLLFYINQATSSIEQVTEKAEPASTPCWKRNKHGKKLLLVSKEGNLVGVMPKPCKEWNCPVCQPWLKSEWSKIVKNFFENSVYFSIVAEGEERRWRDRINYRRGDCFQIYNGNENLLLVLSNVCVKGMTAVRGKEFDALLDRFFSLEKNPLGKKHKVRPPRGLNFKQREKNGQYDVCVVQGDVEESLVTQGAEEITGPEKEGKPMRLFRCPDRLMLRLRRIVKGEMVPIFNSQDPLNFAKPYSWRSKDNG